MTAEAVFWICAALAAWVYIGYPVALAALSSILRRRIRRAPIEPRVSILVAAYNEAPVIAEKVRNCLALDYPPEKLEIAIASDGSRDATAELARAAGGERVRVFEYPLNRGKISVLNESIPRLHGDIVVLTDAATMLEPGALRVLLENFADPIVGVAGGTYKVRKRRQAELGVQEDLYWKYETFLKRCESTFSSTLGAHGALYAIRKELYPYPPAGTINDDYIIPLRVVQRGRRVVYDPRAVAYEEAKEMGGFGRRVRIMAGNIQQLREIGPLLWPPRPLPLFFFFSRKVGRLLAPFAMLGALVASLALWGEPLYRAAAVGQITFYVLAAIGAAVPLHPRLLRLPYYFCMINAAVFWAAARLAAGRGRLSWKH